MQRSIFALLLATATFAGCGGSSSDPQILPPIAVGDLKQVAGPEELETSIKAGFLTLGVQPDPTAILLPSSADFTGTYTQEAQVDEADTVRYDGDFLYVAPTRFYNCCFIVDGGPGVGLPTPQPAQSIRIMATDASAAAASLSGSIELEDGVSVQGMYVEDDRLFALTATAYFGNFGDFWGRTSIWAPESLGYRIYDVADKSAPVLQSDVQIDGVLVDSRRIGDAVYIVSRYAPLIDGLLYTVTTPADQAQNEALLADVPLDALLPKVTIDGVESTLIDPANCYVTTDNDNGFPVLTSVTRVPIDNPSAMTTTCYNDEAHGVYMTLESLYFTAVNWAPDGGQATTSVHKFDLGGATPTYRGSAEVAGQVWRGGQSDFRMSEHDGDLRIVTERSSPDVNDRFDHSLYVLRESTSAPVLDVIGELPNAQRPEEIGRPNEALYGVRFFGDRAYAVTFEQIDPLYTIDLSDPTDPKIAGELTVTGFSDFLHPVSDELLLGLGTAQGGGVKVELFDVSVISQPLSRGAVLLGASSTTEATYDRRAFTYLPGPVDRMAIPVSQLVSNGQYGAYVTSLQLFEIRDKTLPNLASLVSVGELQPPADASDAWSDRNRSYLNADAVFFVRDTQVWAAFWSTPHQMNGPF